MDAVRLDPALVKEDSLEWKLYDETPEYRRFAAMDEQGNLVIKTEFLAEAALLRQNKAAYDASHDKKFGDGQVVASVPMNVWTREIAPRLRDGDLDFSKWWLNRSENRPYRTFRGKI